MMVPSQLRMETTMLLLVYWLKVSSHVGVVGNEKME